MYNTQLMQVLNTTDDLLHKGTCFLLFELLLLNDIVKKLSATDVLHDQEQLLGRLNDFKQLNYIWVSNHFENINFTGHSLYISFLCYFAFFKYFNRNLKLEQLVFV